MEYCGIRRQLFADKTSEIIKRPVAPNRMDRVIVYNNDQAARCGPGQDHRETCRAHNTSVILSAGSGVPELSSPAFGVAWRRPRSAVSSRRDGDRTGERLAP